MENIKPKYDLEETEGIIEDSVAGLYRGIFRLCEDALHQDAYYTLGVVLDLVMECRTNLRTNHNCK